MTASDDNITPAGQDPAPLPLRSANTDALLWLATWMGLPFLALVALYYAEPIFQPRPTTEFVQTVTHTEVYPTNGQGPSLAPAEVPRPKPMPFPTFPGAPAAPPPSGSEIVAHPISQPQPIYPARAIEREKEGFVRVRITIAPDGTVSDATVLLAQPPGWFEAAALDAVRRWTYQPPGRQLVTESVIEFKLN